MSEGAGGYPQFINKDCKHWFYHWFSLLRKREKCAEECDVCACVKDNIVFATSLLLEVVFSIHDRFTSGADIVSINIGHMSKKMARNILRDSQTKCKKELSGDSLLRLLRRDFPGLCVTDALKESLDVKFVPLMGKGGNSLYYTLSLLYKKAMRFSSDTSLTKIATVDYILLCFHLNKQYLLTPNVVTNLWSGALKLNTIVTCFSEDRAETDILDKLFKLGKENGPSLPS